jgi:hypothetical protein
MGKRVIVYKTRWAEGKELPTAHTKSGDYYYSRWGPASPDEIDLSNNAYIDPETIVKAEDVKQ